MRRSKYILNHESAPSPWSISLRAGRQAASACRYDLASSAADDDVRLRSTAKYSAPTWSGTQYDRMYREAASPKVRRRFSSVASAAMARMTSSLSDSSHRVFQTQSSGSSENQASFVTIQGSP